MRIGGNDMKFNFDEKHDRTNNQSLKWGMMEDVFGREDLLPLWVADMDFKTSDHIVQALSNRVAEGIYGYTVRVDSYYEAFTNWVKRRHGWSVKNEDIIYSPGVVPSLVFMIQALTNEGDALIVQPPVYGPFKRSIVDHKREVLNNPMILKDGHYTLDYDNLEKQIDAGGKVLIFCNPQNPVGRVWKKDELEKLAEIVVRKKIIVISDEIHSDLMLSGQKHIPLASLNDDIKSRTITCMSPSKTFNLAGLQSSVIVVSDDDLKMKVNKIFEVMDMKINNCFGQVAFEAAYNHGEEWLSELLDYIEDNMNYVINYFEEHLHEITIRKPEGTYLLWMDCRALGFTHHQLTEFMIDKAGLALTDGTFFGEEGEGFMRMNVACPRSTLEQAMKQLSSAIKHMRL